MELEISKPYDFEKSLKPTVETKAVPTLDRRHVSWIREGKQSGEVFCKNHKRRLELGLPIVQLESDEL